MARKLLVRHPHFPYHIYNRSIDRCFYEVDMAELWRCFSDLLRTLKWAYGFKIHSAVLMNNHYHLALSAPDLNLDDGMQYFQSQFSLWLNKKTGLQKSRFSGRYKWSVIRTPSHFESIQRYIYQNPVRAGICSRSEFYQFSTLSGVVGNSLHLIPVCTHEWESLFYEDTCSPSFLDWANRFSEVDQLNAIRRGLRHAFYAPPRRMQKGA